MFVITRLFCGVSAVGLTFGLVITAWATNAPFFPTSRSGLAPYPLLPCSILLAARSCAVVLLDLQARR